MSSTFNLSKVNTAISKANTLAVDLTLNGHVLPPLPPFPDSAVISIAKVDGYAVNTVNEELDTRYTDIFGTSMCFPLRLRKVREEDKFFWLLPTEPMITITAPKRLTRVNVAKNNLQKGSIKQRIDNDDLVIQIDGLLTKKDNWTYPKNDVIRLRELCEACFLDVECELFEYFKINQIAIEKFEFPFTKGEENQRYSITAYSDDKHDLFIPLDAGTAEEINNHSGLQIKSR